MKLRNLINLEERPLFERTYPFWFYIYGFNISILAGLFMKLFSRMLGRWRGALLAALVIAFYTLLVVAGASVVRAAIMGGLRLFARRGDAAQRVFSVKEPTWLELEN